MKPFAGIDPHCCCRYSRHDCSSCNNVASVFLLLDHNVRETLSIVDKAYILAEGKIFIAW